MFLLLFLAVSCRPEPEVKWFCNDLPISPSSRHILEHDKGVYRLTIRGLTRQDAGEWRCVAINNFGRAGCSCDLKVIGKSQDCLDFMPQL
jgi:titin